MKIVMTLLVRDEQDIICENIEYHLSQGVDFFIVTDNKSVDKTTEILKEYERKGIVHYIYEGEDNYEQHKWVTRMAVMAFEDFGADWVINNDADEFWWPLTGNLADTFKLVPHDTNLVEVNRLDFVMLKVSALPFYERMVFKKTSAVNTIGGTLPSKVAHRGSSDVKIKQGNHGVIGFENLQMIQGAIEILHFPMRSPAQFVNKIVKGGAAYERNEVLPKGVGITWRTLYSEYLKNSNLDDFFLQHFYNQQRIEKELANGNLIVDQRLNNYLSLNMSNSNQ